MTPRAGRLIAVGGGKGGVGKSLVALNLAVALAHEGYEVTVVDGDLGAPTLHTLLGVDRLPRTLDDALVPGGPSLSSVRLSTPVPRLALVAGSPARIGAADISEGEKRLLVAGLAELDGHAVVIDVGAGTSFTTLDLFNAADLRLIVTTPQLTAIQNAYAFAKGSVHRQLQLLSRDRRQHALLSFGQDEDTARIHGLIGRVRSASPTLGDAVGHLLGAAGTVLVANQLRQAADANVVHAVSRMMKDFLSISAPVQAMLRLSQGAHDSVNRRRPWLLDAGHDGAAGALRELATHLAGADVGALRVRRAMAFRLATEASVRHHTLTPLPVELSALQRRHRRLTTRLPVTLSRGQLAAEGTVRDLSRGGALVATAAELARGSRWLITFHSLPGCPAVEALVRHCRPGEGVAGVEFAAGAMPAPLEALLTDEVAA